jgi:hypothetical protein
MATAIGKKRFGILVEMPENDPMSAPHLLGDNWSSTRWFDEESARDVAFEQMSQQPGYYRKGDKPSIRLTKISSE